MSQAAIQLKALYAAAAAMQTAPTHSQCPDTSGTCPCPVWRLCPLTFVALAGERERLAGERLQAANSRAASSMAALQAVQSEVTESARSCQSEYRLRMDAEARAQRLEHQLQQVGVSHKAIFI